MDLSEIFRSETSRHVRSFCHTVSLRHTQIARLGYPGYKKADTGLSSKHSNGGSLDRYTADPNQRGVQTRADIIRPRPTPCKLQIPHQPRKTSSPVVKPACVYSFFIFIFLFLSLVSFQRAIYVSPELPSGSVCHTDRRGTVFLS